MDRVKISATVITYNEETNIRQCLESINWVDEIIVVDAMSTDRTRQIASGFTDKVFIKEWTGYRDAREFAISKVTSDWVLSVDADERITPELRQEINQVLVNPECDGYLIPRKAYFLGRWIKHCGWYPGYVLRLFRKDKARVTPKLVHEGIEVKGPIGKMKNPILHYTYPTLEIYLKRLSNYTSLAATDLYRRGKRANALEIVIRPLYRFIMMYFLKLGFLDGFEGLVLCALSSYYVFIKYLKLRALASKGTEKCS